MDYKSIFSALSMVAVLVYLYIGLFTWKDNRKSIINRVFFLLCISYAIWSFAFAFAYVSYSKYIFSFWNKLSAFGWCTFSAITLYLVLLITDNKLVKKRYIQILIFAPALLFLYMALFLFGVGINTPTAVSNFFYIGDFIYNFVYLLLSIIIILIWGIGSDRIRIKLQSKILIIASVIPFCLNLITQTLLPLMGYHNFPLMGQLYSIIMIIGAYTVIKKYKFLKIPEKFVLEEVEKRILDMFIVVNEKGELIRISNHTLAMLEFQENELLHRNIMELFDSENKEQFTLSRLMQHEVSYYEVEISKKNGEGIPVKVECIPIWDDKIKDFLGVAFVMRDISIEYELRRKNQELLEKNIRDGLTNLYNHQYSFEIIEREINEINNEDNSKEMCLLMIDIDYFKRVNDNYGHLFGDYVLKTVSGIMTIIVNYHGYIGRFGGEEFIVILPKIGFDQAYGIGEKIRKEIEHYKFDQGLKVTVSLGLAQYKNQNCIDFVKKADDSLYRAKQNGRNRIEY